MSLIDERGEKAVRMANLATVASQRVNGVAALHSQLLRDTVLKDFADAYPDRFLNITNGITPRRFLALANPGLARLITETIGDGWRANLERLRDLASFATDDGFCEEFRAVKQANKDRLAAWLRSAHGVDVDAAFMFDAQCKRIHEYKRQHLALLHIVWLYGRILRGDVDDIVPRTFIFAGKAAPAYQMAKLIIRLITAIGETIERSPAAREYLRVVFAPDFSVKNAQRIYPAVDLSEQISTAGMEASGTGNMKFALNGALTIGTLDGANVEIREAVGPGHFFLFGMTAQQVAERRAHYRPVDVLAADPEFASVVGDIRDGRFSPGDRTLFEPLVRSLVEHDPFFVLADFRDYAECQRRVARAWRDPVAWSRAAILNVAAMGPFSADRSIRQYAHDVWNVAPVTVLHPDVPSIDRPPR
jgi:starch phosphorylase